MTQKVDGQIPAPPFCAFKIDQIARTYVDNTLCTDVLLAEVLIFAFTILLPPPL